MNATNLYIFTSERLGFRNWKESDLELMYEINSDEDVMEFFPSTPTKLQTLEFINRMQNQFIKNGFCYFAVEKLENNEFIGFIGLSEQNYEADFTPCIDIGWRIKKSEWNKGLATEGAKKCLDFAFKNLQLLEICSVAPIINEKSQRIMQKIGMTKYYEFNHSLLNEFPHLQTCALYKINNPSKINHE